MIYKCKHKCNYTYHKWILSVWDRNGKMEKRWKSERGVREREEERVIEEKYIKEKGVQIKINQCLMGRIEIKIYIKIKILIKICKYCIVKCCQMLKTQWCFGWKVTLHKIANNSSVVGNTDI